MDAIDVQLLPSFNDLFGSVLMGIFKYSQEGIFSIAFVHRLEFSVHFL